MISTVLASNPDLVRVLFWVAIAVGSVLGWILHRMRARKVLTAFTIISLLGPLVLTLSPSTAQPESFCYVQFSVPFRGIETLANLAMLIPLALFATLLLRRPLLVFAAVSGLSAIIELVQAVAPGLGRSCDTDDWFMNTVGAAIGVLVAAGILLLDERRTAPSTTARDGNSTAVPPGRS